MATIRPIDIGSMAPGLNNKLPPTALAKKLPDGSMGTYLYGADNVDLNEKGTLKRRQGTTTLIAGPTHSLWSDVAGAFAVHAGTLKRVTPTGAGLVTLEDIRANLPPAPLSYSRGGDGDVYWSNGIELRRITYGGDAPVATPMPNPQPTVSVSTGGSLPAGGYLLAFTALSANGESPATPVQRLDVPPGGLIRISNAIPVEVYLSAPDGDVLTLQAQGVTTLDLTTWTQDRRRCMTLNKVLMPPGRIVRHYRGRLLTAQGPILYIGDPYNFGIYDADEGYIPFPADITVIEPTDNGCYICADKTYWIADLLGGDLQELLPFGGVYGTSGRSPNEETVFWNSPNGLVTADRNASVKTVQSDALQFGGAASGASLYRRRDGMTHVVASRSDAQPSTAIATSFFEARVIQKGTDL